jgi:hypothetical protein
MHALNAFFGEALIDAKQFQKYQEDFDALMKTKYKEDISCKQFDLVNSDQNNIITFILKKKGYYARYIPLNTMQGKNLPLDEVKGDFIFMYNETHIWGLRKHQNLWWSVDSMNGVRKTNIYRITRTKNVGFMIPVFMKKELYNHVGKVKALLGKENIETKSDVEEYLKKLNERKEILGELEVHLGVAMDLVEAQINGTKQDSIYNPIYNLHELYCKFLEEFMTKKYSLETLKKYIPHILSGLMKLCFQIKIE